MATGTVVLHPAPPLLRDLVYRLLEPGYEVVDIAEWRARQAQRPGAAAPIADDVHLVVAPSGARPEDAALLARSTSFPTVIILGGNGRWGVRVEGGAVQRVLVEVTPEALRGLVRG
ncbi:MAG: hypothetical protein IT359_03870 [Gemmatimonadaceae bacterium]|nr:hypothetical protein [Gemmatimonadaceae bacterium]